MMDPNDYLPGNGFAWVSAAVGGLFTGALWLRQHWSGSSAVMATDRAERNMLERMAAENRELRSALETVTRERNDLYVKLGDLTGASKVLEARLDMQQRFGQAFDRSTQPITTNVEENFK